MEFTSKIALIEAVKPELAPFGDQVHNLLLESVSKIADDWIAQLTLLRQTADELEAQIIASVGKTKADIISLHQLGTKVAEEARRGQEVCRLLSDGVGRIAT
jgi:hypothetical protein